MSDMSMARATMEMETKIHCDGGESVENIRGWLLTHECLRLSFDGHRSKLSETVR